MRFLRCMHPLDRKCEKIAARQFGLIARDQALVAGLTEAQIDYRVRTGRWESIHPGVYVIAGGPSTWHQQVMAACLWTETGYASHRSAAALWNLAGFGPSSIIDVTVTRCHLPPRCGLKVHSTDRILSGDVGSRMGIPTCAIERTLLDLGAVAHERKVAIAVDDALRRGLTTLPLLDSYRRSVSKQGRRGCGVLRRVLEPRMGLKELPNSALETVFFELRTRSLLPAPELQYEIRHDGEFVARPDFAWPDRRKAVEMDSYQFHSGYEFFHQDRERLNKLAMTRWQVLHGTWKAATTDPVGFVDRVERFVLGLD